MRLGATPLPGVPVGERVPVKQGLLNVSTCNRGATHQSDTGEKTSSVHLFNTYEVIA
jgi:hypothetical protein